MRTLVVTVALVGFMACSSGPSKEAKAAVETYINTDLNGLVGILWVGKRPLESITPEHYDTAHGWFERPSALETIVIPRMDQVIAGAAKITPPEAMKTAHQLMIDVAKGYRAAAVELGDAVAANDKAKFATAHANLMEGHARYLRWQALLDEALNTYKITLKDQPIPAELPK